MYLLRGFACFQTKTIFKFYIKYPHFRIFLTRRETSSYEKSLPKDPCFCSVLQVQTKISLQITGEELKADITWGCEEKKISRNWSKSSLVMQLGRDYHYRYQRQSPPIKRVHQNGVLHTQKEHLKNLNNIVLKPQRFDISGESHGGSRGFHALQKDARTLHMS